MSLKIIYIVSYLAVMNEPTCWLSRFWLWGTD